MRLPKTHAELDLATDAPVFLFVVGPNFDRNVRNALMTAREGYCHALSDLNIPYSYVDTREAADVAERCANPILFLVGADYVFLGKASVRRIKRHKKVVWVDPWFEDSESFFARHNLDASVWTWPAWHRARILESEPTVAVTGTVPRGLCFFSEWVNHGVRVESLPLACDTRLFRSRVPEVPDFRGIKLGFVGGYWPSKGKQIDEYVRKFESDLTVFGYTRWPYKDYRGGISPEAEVALYRQALICPTINEPSVRVLHGQINERAFKIMGSGGVTVTDAVQGYRDLFKSDELLVPGSPQEFSDMVIALLSDPCLRERYRDRGTAAVLGRHTYAHRVKQLGKALNVRITSVQNDSL